MAALHQIIASGAKEENDKEAEERASTKKPDKEVEVKEGSTNAGAKLNAGFTTVMERGAILRERFEKKLADSPDMFRCKKCGQALGTEPEALTHLQSTGHGESVKEHCLVEKSLPVSLEDRLLDTDQAALLIQKGLPEAIPSDRRLTPEEELLRVPLMRFEKALSVASDETLKKFVQLRFDSTNSVKRVLAATMLSRRSKNGSK